MEFSTLANRLISKEFSIWTEPVGNETTSKVITYVNNDIEPETMLLETKGSTKFDARIAIEVLSTAAIITKTILTLYNSGLKSPDQIEEKVKKSVKQERINQITKVKSIISIVTAVLKLIEELQKG
ncbi:hypothetical protein FHW88_000523 [Mucilaginibacter sp. SG538B]|uniref:hypothetical protein n=1 Tax=Mucilaginibacter sp. SG538B TaxID=2587021 RepID=UPI00159E57F0|nr:hypothetical protein [Mucilaginibacter sp. SG538B]NVM62247.1 hypothetical protein [Mucilaginibacter sp. SG538B]